MRLWNGPTSWGDSSIPQPSLSGRRVALPQGRGLGGGSSMNGMAWFHGHPADYDGWRAGGEPEWAWRDVQPAFRAVERSELADGEWHGSDGPMRMARTRDVSALPLGFVAAGAELGLPVVEDFNGAEREGIGLLQADIDDGRRHSVVNGYLLPTLDRSNLTVRAGTLVTSIVIKEAEPLPYCASTRMDPWDVSTPGARSSWRRGHCAPLSSSCCPASDRPVTFGSTVSKSSATCPRSAPACRTTRWSRPPGRSSTAVRCGALADLEASLAGALSVDANAHWETSHLSAGQRPTRRMGTSRCQTAAASELPCTDVTHTFRRGRVWSRLH